MRIILCYCNSSLYLLVKRVIMISVYFHKDVCFKSRYSLSDSVTRLSARVKTNRPMERLKGGLFGSVEPNKVLLWHLNLPRPYAGMVGLKGSFAGKNGCTELSGRFEIPKSTRVLLNGCLIVSIILLFFPFIYEMSESASVDLLTVPVILLVIWIVSVFFYHRGAIVDIEYISQMIKTAFE